MRTRFLVAAAMLWAAASGQQVQPQPVSVGIVFDTSGSMGAKLRLARETVDQFLKTARPGDEFFLVSFDDEPALARGLTANPYEIRNRLAFVQPRGGSALFDAVYMAVRELSAAKNSRKALLVISDGADNHSRYSLREVAAAARDAGVKIYTVGIHESFIARTRSQEELGGPGALVDLAEQTDGKHYRINVGSGRPVEAGSAAGAEMRAPVEP
jgi:Ca-activated chloride channel family protein